MTTFPGADAPKRSTPITSPPVAHILAPALSDARFNRKPCGRRWRKNRVPIAWRLGLKQFPARHGYEPNLDLVLGQFLAGRNDQTDFRPGGDQDDVWVAIASLSQNIRALPQPICRRKLSAVK